jgi:hypothetical protein
VVGQLLHDRRDVIRALWDNAWRKSEDIKNVYVDRMRLMGVARGSGRHLSKQRKVWKIFMARGSGRHSSKQGKARKIFNQITTGTISVDTLRWRLRTYGYAPSVMMSILDSIIIYTMKKKTKRIKLKSRF